MMSFVSWMLTTRRQPAHCLEFKVKVIVVGQRPGDGFFGGRLHDREGVVVRDAIRGRRGGGGTAGGTVAKGMGAVIMVFVLVNDGE